MFITREEILMDREKQHPLTPELEENLDRLLIVLNNLHLFPHDRH